jgi:HAD superfamily hydrolase (TIGR01509 family)
MNQLAKTDSTWKHPIRAVAFDMDGLLVNTEELYTVIGTTILQRRGRTFTEHLKNGMTGLPGPQAWALMIQCESLSDSIETLQAESDEIFDEILPKQVKLLAGVSELLDQLDQQSMPRCVATSSSPEFADTVLNLVGIESRFDFVITAYDVDRGKPQPDIYLAAAQRMRVMPPQMLVLEDSHHGCRAGVTSGACTVAVPGQHSRSHDFSGVHWCANTLLDPVISCLLMSPR